MFESRYWGVRSNTPSKQERYDAAISKLTEMVRKSPITSKANLACYHKALELLTRKAD